MLSVIIPTYNPQIDRLQQTLNSLERQSLANQNWELIIIDNNSSNSFEQAIDLGWHHNARIIREEKQGLTYARLKGFENAIYDIIVMVDDDNILDENYLINAFKIFAENVELGAIGGKSTPIFENEVPSWLVNFYGCLALRDLGNQCLTAKWENQYPNCAPIGAGMAIKKLALQTYINKINTGNHQITDRKGNSLSSGGDNDIVIEILKSGWHVGYFPKLTLQHIIPQERIATEYLARLNFESSCSWVKLLHSHSILPWKPLNRKTLQLRYLKSYITNKAWKNAKNYIKWRGACGIFKGLSEL